MASSSTLKKRTKRACVTNAEPSEFNETGYLECWFAGNYKSMEEYHREFSRKVIIAPKVLKMLWMKEEKLDDVREALRFQKLEICEIVWKCLSRLGQGFSDQYVV